MKVDMSPAAIEARLRQVSDLRDLCLYLGTFQKVAEQEDVQIEEKPPTATKRQLGKQEMR